MRAAFFVFALAGCDAGLPAAPPSHAPVARGSNLDAAVPDAAPPSIDAAPPADAAPPEDETPIALPPRSSGWVNRPSWPTGDRVAFTWLVYPASPETLAAPIQLVATVGAVSRVLTFAPQVGALHSYLQGLCPDGAFPLERGEVAKVTLEEGGFDGVLVRRAGRSAVELVEWALTDGACDDGHSHFIPCKRYEKPVARMHVPAGATFTETIVQVDRAGERHPLECGSDLDH